MVEAPKLSQPIVTEEWVDEDRLNLWVIKQYHERIEKATAMAAAASTTPSTPHLTRLKGTPQTMGPGGKPMTMEELKAQEAEQQLLAQRTAHQLKSSTPGTLTGVVRLTLPAGNKVALPGNKLLSTPSGASGSPMGRRILITKDGKTSQVVKTTVASPSGSAQSVLIAPSPGVAAATPTVNKLQISRGPDGKIEIRGLKPGQQLLKLSDGRFTIVSPAQPMITAQPAPAQAQTQVQPTAASHGSGTKTVVVQKAVTVAGQKTTSQIVCRLVPTLQCWLST
jgi:nucleosome-remodeling factor subunit BPTF